MMSFKDRMKQRRAAAAKAAERPAAKPLTEEPRAEVSDEQLTTPFVAPKKEAQESPTREMPAGDSAKLAAEAEEAPEPEPAFDITPRDAVQPAPPRLPPLPSLRTEEKPKAAVDLAAMHEMLKKSLEPLTTALANLEEHVKEIRTAVFGEDMNAAVEDVLEKEPVVTAFDKALAGAVKLVDLGLQFKDGEFVPLLDRDGNPVPSALPLGQGQAAVDLSGIEAEVADLKQKMYLMARDGEVLPHMIEVHKNEKGEPKYDEDGNLDFDCALVVMGNNMTIEDQFGKDGELLPMYEKHAHKVIETDLVAKMLKTELDDEDLAEIQETAGECPDACRQILEKLAVDEIYLKDVMARVDGKSLRDLDEPRHETLRMEIENYLPRMKERVQFFLDDLPWDALEQRLRTAKKGGEDETGGDA